MLRRFVLSRVWFLHFPLRKSLDEFRPLFQGKKNFNNISDIYFNRYFSFWKESGTSIQQSNKFSPGGTSVSTNNLLIARKWIDKILILYYKMFIAQKLIWLFYTLRIPILPQSNTYSPIPLLVSLLLLLPLLTALFVLWVQL